MSKLGSCKYIETKTRTAMRGAAAVEFALLLPLLLLTAATTADYGRIAHHYIALSNATRSGAEYGSRHGFTTFTRASWEEQVKQAVVQEAEETPTLDLTQLDITVSTVADDDDLLRIAVKANLRFTTTVAWPWLPNVVDLSHVVEMRQIR